MKLLSTTKVDSKHVKYTYQHRFKKSEKPQQFEIISFNPERAQAKAWDKVKSEHSRRKNTYNEYLLNQLENQPTEQ